MAHRHQSLKFQRVLLHCKSTYRNLAVIYTQRYYSSNKESKIVPIGEIRCFIIKCLECLDVDTRKAKIFANCMVAADYKGKFSHGLIRLEHYLYDIKKKICNANANPQMIAECKSTATVSGGNGLGSVIGLYCMELAIKKAVETGIGMVVAKGSNHFGINSFYTDFAIDHGYIGLVFTNTPPIMVPTGSKQVCLGSNPIAIGAPAMKTDSISIDLATTATAFGKIEQYKLEKKTLPVGWALDKNGKPTTNPEVAVQSGKLTPLGGSESHKGTALALMVEILSGLIAGSAYGPKIKKWGLKSPKPANIGHGFIAIDASKFGTGFSERLSDLMSTIRRSEPVNPKFKPVIPGDIEREHMKKIDKQGGIIYTANHWQVIDRIVKDLGVAPPKTN